MAAMVRATVHTRFEPLKKKFTANFENNWEIGSSASAYFKNDCVAKLYGGEAVFGNVRKPYDASTLQLVASSTKFVEAVAIALLVDRGLLKYEEPIASYWPQFAQNGKSHITLRQMMMMRAGLPALDGPLTDTVVFSDSNIIGDVLAKQQPFWDVPEDAIDAPQPQAYHAITRGLFLSQICQRVDPKGRTLAQFVRDELCDPLGIECYIGLRHLDQQQQQAIIPRISTTISNPNDLKLAFQAINTNEPSNDPRFDFNDSEKLFLSELVKPNSLASKALFTLLKWDDPPQQLERFGMDFRNFLAEMPSSNGITNSYSLAHFGSFMCQQWRAEWQENLSKRKEGFRYRTY